MKKRVSVNRVTLIDTIFTYLRSQKSKEFFDLRFSYAFRRAGQFLVSYCYSIENSTTQRELNHFVVSSLLIDRIKKKEKESEIEIDTARTSSNFCIADAATVIFYNRINRYEILRA